MMRRAGRILPIVFAAISATSRLFAQGDIRSQPFPKERPKPLTLAFKKPEDGTVEVAADEQDWVKDVSWVGIGNVVVKYGAVKLQADRMRVELGSTDVDAEGHVILDEGPNRLSGARLHYNLTTKLGHLVDAEADLDPSYHFTGEILEKVGMSDYVFEHGLFTSCSMPDPGWSFRVSRGEFTIGEYATLHQTTFRLAGFPLLYFPWMKWPVRSERNSGWLIPSVGYNSQRGASIGSAYYQVLGSSADATLFLDGYTKGFEGLGAEYRQSFVGGGAGEVLGYAIYDSNARDLQWKYRLRIRDQNLPGEFRLIVDALDYSDRDFFRLFERVQRLAISSTLTQTASLSADRGPFTFNLRARRTENISTSGGLDDRTILTNFPGLEVRSRSSKIGNTPLYWTVLASADLLEKTESNRLASTPVDGGSKWARADFSPKLSAGFRLFPWLSFSPELGVRETWYSKHRDPDHALSPFLVDESFENRVGTFKTTVVGPVFYRLFEASLGPFVRLKHVIEPRFEYTKSRFLGNAPEANLAPQFDEVDGAAAAYDGGSLRVAVVNRLLGKEAKEGASARELASLEVSRTYTLNSPAGTLASSGTKGGPLQLSLRANPGASFNISGTASYQLGENGAPSGLTSNSLGVSWAGADARAGFNWGGIHDVTSGTSNGTLTVFGRVPVLPKRLSVDASIMYQVQNRSAATSGVASSGGILTQRWLIEYHGDCWSLFAEFLDDRLRNPHRREYRIAINLKDVGTFIDVSGGLESLPF